MSPSDTSILRVRIALGARPLSGLGGDHEEVVTVDGGYSMGAIEGSEGAELLDEEWNTQIVDEGESYEETLEALRERNQS